MTKNRINKAIRHLNLEIVGNGDGYFYFCDLTTGEQIGESVLVCYLKHQTLQRWVEDAQEARDSNIVSGVNLNQYAVFNAGNIN
jgi:triphosphoribosyl-dephospho-CoA synthetase